VIKFSEFQGWMLSFCETIRTLAAVPCTSITCPSLMTAVAVPVPTTAGRKYSRATTALWLRTPPLSVTSAAVRANRGVHDGRVYSVTCILGVRSLQGVSDIRRVSDRVRACFCPSCKLEGYRETGELPVFQFLANLETHRSGRYTTQNDLHMENREGRIGNLYRGEKH
jgi:hypothetical protein